MTERLASIHRFAWSVVGMIVALLMAVVTAHVIRQATQSSHGFCRSGIRKVFFSQVRRYDDIETLTYQGEQPSLVLCNNGELVKP